MAPKGMKASKVFERKSKVKVVEWVLRKGARGKRYVPVDVSASTSQQTQGRDAAGMEIDNHEEILHDADPSSMDVCADETFRVEESVIPEQRKVSRPTIFHSSAVLDIVFSPSAPTWKSLFSGLAPICVASSVLRVSQPRQCARAACLLHFNGGALTVFLLSYSARSAAENPTSGFLSTEFRSGQGSTLCHHGCGRLE
jgi:hypothetical protein